ncbi:LytR/AlgR family response regulator transcription factor [Aquiflexum gelatinilyticum]|uniref:LytTR family transcriptional regulator DNA-binding domain-containing protein n=1 Tax=Aquiflexum gelatinilyticum TaxID=2961943 RepID=A0A9X2PAB6_9BACT|nr:LytTR family transcriptional regulator DNA-binding domain-containing protein [Aquiflexum gelatinilyticum]MCR9015959.1 LytTR family transcriptional regulator DNA-binding domain-containing protein [Aquiflexum gelatinilyticum]
MIKVLIMDDEPLATELVSEYLADFPQFEIQKVCHDGFEGLKAIQEHKPDLIFLDIQMPKLTGFEMLELLDNPPAVIFTTAFDAFALKAFDAHAVDYLLKPFSKARFAKSLEKFLQMGNNLESINAFKNESVLNPESANRVVLKVKNEIKIIPINEIKYLEANDDYVNIYTKEGKFLKNKTLSFYEKSLDTSLFVRVHRSYLVNISEITKIEPYEKEGYMLKLREGENIPVSKSGFPKLKLVLGI